MKVSAAMRVVVIPHGIPVKIAVFCLVKLKTSLKVGVISEGIFKLVPSSNKCMESLLSTFQLYNVYDILPFDQQCIFFYIQEFKS